MDRTTLFLFFLINLGLTTFTVQAQPDSLPVPKSSIPDLSASVIPREDSMLQSKPVLILPLVIRSVETDWSFGVAGSFTFRLLRGDTTARTSNAQVLALYSVRKQFITAINGTIYFPHERYILNHQISYSAFPDKFWGLGKFTPDANEENYSFRQYYIYLHLQRQIRPHFFVGLLYEYQRLLRVDHAPGDLFDQEQVVGRRPYDISGAGLSLTFDNRNNAFAPDRGSLAQVFFNHFDPVLGATFRFTNYTIDLRTFRQIYKNQVLALQAYGGFGGGAVPLRSLASFGGSNSMRGYYDGRYRDKNQFVFQAEYRVPLFWRFGAVAFADMGNVASRISDLNFQSLKYTVGGGLRFALKKDERLNLRLDYGVARGGVTGLYFQLGEAF